MQVEALEDGLGELVDDGNQGEEGEDNAEPLNRLLGLGPASHGGEGVDGAHARVEKVKVEEELLDVVHDSGDLAESAEEA